MELKDVQFKASADPLQGILTGFGAIYGNIDQGSDRIVAGASRKTIAERMHKIKVCWDHNLDDAWARVTRLEEVPKSALPPEILAEAPDATGGLYMEAKAPLTQTNIDRLMLIQAGVKDGLSIGYDAVEHEFKSENGRRIRELKEIKLYEISVVTLGMNAAALVTGVKDAQHAAPPRERLSRKASGETFTYTMQRVADALQEAYGSDPTLYNPYAVPMMADGDGPGCTIADLYSDAVIVCDKDYDAYWEIPYTLVANGTVTLGTPQLVKVAYAPIPPGGPEDLGQMAHAGAAERKAEWTAAYVNDLPDSAFAYIAPGGKKDDEGKTTPRSLRHYPHHDASGKVDLPHLRNALSRIGDDANEQAGKAHLEAHAKQEDVGDAGKAAPAAAARKAPLHPFDGTHSHPHSAMGDQGDDETHEHAHSHDGDGDHGHAHGKALAALPSWKAGRRNSASDAAHLLAAHDHLHAALGMPAHDETGNTVSDGDGDTDGDGEKAMTRLLMARLRSLSAN